MDSIYIFKDVFRDPEQRQTLIQLFSNISNLGEYYKEDLLAIVRGGATRGKRGHINALRRTYREKLYQVLQANDLNINPKHFLS